MKVEEQIVQSVKDTRVVAIIRGMAPEICVKLAESYRSGGIRLVEVTFDQTGDLRKTAEAIRAIRAACPDMFVGAGTVLSRDQLQMAIDAGGAFMVTPTVNVDVIRACVSAGLVAMPGAFTPTAFTPTEILTAYEAGAHFVKVFPIRAVGPTYIKDVLAPLKHIPLLAVGGVTPANVADYIKAGCAGVGVSGALVNKEWIAAGAWDKIAAAARELVENSHV